MEKRGLKKLVAVLVVVSVVLIVAVAAVVWKLTKDAYEVSEPETQRIDPSRATSTPATQLSTKRVYTQEELKSQPWLSLRLSPQVVPVHYNITLFPDFYGDHDSFSGNETIEVNITTPTRHIIFHMASNYMNVTRARVLTSVTGEDLAIHRSFSYPPNEFYVIETKLAVSQPVVVKLEFEGSLTKAIVGLYKSTYINSFTNQTMSMVSTKFEPTYARYAFPCFDEPVMKAMFTITMIHRPEYTALSNMPVQRQEQSLHGLVSTTFETSVKMSTYLVCVVVSEYNYTETRVQGNMTLRVYAAPDKIPQTTYALEVANTTLSYYQDIFQFKFPLPKQDLIAIPNFVAGATEHWGLITFRESAVLFNPEQASLLSQQTVAITITHELAHQWFGNLATMEWWNDLWLNEGFATFLQYVGLEHINADWDLETMFLERETFPVMRRDSELASHPIITSVESPSEVTSVFDLISYDKGSSIIRMLYSVMGHSTFFKGITAYLNRYQYGNAKTDDLWNIMSENSENLDVKYFMDTWTVQQGFPYINISLTPNANGTTTVTARQERFLSNPENKVNPTESPFGYKWFIHLDYITSTGQKGQEIMNLTDITFVVNISLNDPRHWIKFNTDTSGFYSVLYPVEMWIRLTSYLRNTDPKEWTLSASDRSGLVNDAFIMAASGKVGYDVTLSLFSYMKSEAHDIPWMVLMMSGFNYINSMLDTFQEYQLWKAYVFRTLSPVIRDIGYTENKTEPQTLRNRRVILVNILSGLGHQETLAYVKAVFRAWLDNGTSVPVDFRQVIYQYGMRYGGSDDDWDKIWNKYLTETSPQERDLLLKSLTHVRKPYFIDKILDLALQEKYIKRQDFFGVIQNLAINTAATSLLWNWVQEHYQFLRDRFTLVDHDFGQMVYFVVRNYNTDFQLSEVQRFFTLYPEAGSGERSRKLAIENINRNIYWMKHFRPDIVHWLGNEISQS
ncbi:hypothetical protein BgiMline_004674 [Biomphalaria glabrata]|nr:glutamyl aminopeptidase [Biomphalaria glabrata]